MVQYKHQLPSLPPSQSDEAGVSHLCCNMLFIEYVLQDRPLMGAVQLECCSCLLFPCLDLLVHFIVPQTRITLKTVTMTLRFCVRILCILTDRLLLLQISCPDLAGSGTFVKSQFCSVRFIFQFHPVRKLVLENC